MLVQVGLCRTCSETTLLVFPLGGSFPTSTQQPSVIEPSTLIIRISKECILDRLKFWKGKQNTFETHHEKKTFPICKNKGADQLCSNCKADQRLSFRYMNSTRMPQRSISHLHRTKYLDVKYRSRAPGQGVRLKGMSRAITMQGFTFAATLGAEKIKL